VKTNEINNKLYTVITSHVNSDYDSIASMLAAKKIYPDAKIVYPGYTDKNPKNFFINSMVYLCQMVSIKDIELKNVKRLVLVDTRQTSRIGRFAEIVDRPDISIHIYDHHPDAKGDIKGEKEVIKITGATVTIMTEILKEKNIFLTPDEATMLCLGIYEDTGSFTFKSTTSDDFNAASYLLSKGANIETISNIISREISPQQVSLLNDLIVSGNRYEINGIDVLITTVSTDDYVNDFAFVVQKLMKMENPSALFVLARMGSRIYLIGRSRVSEIDVASIIRSFGGGGHPFAASATIKNKTLTQTQDKLVQTLYLKVHPRLAKSLMTSPAIRTGPTTTIKEASKILRKYNINALLVVENLLIGEELLGLITRQVVERAIAHKLDEVSVTDYMTSELETVEPDAKMEEIQEKVISNKQRLLPVVEDDFIVGVITRTDILNAILSNEKQKLKSNSFIQDSSVMLMNARTRKVRHIMKERINNRILNMLIEIGEVADQLNLNAYVVGGFVRDLFLKRKNEDIDIVIEGDGIAFAKKYARIANARIHTHEKFSTAVVIFPDNFKIDVASARTEYYESPASLPIVEKSSIKLDLYRRDFSINTLVIKLNSDSFGTLIDFFNSYQDLKERTIRVLHNLSFVDDPTRIFRAIRFEQRFGFSIGKLTINLINNAVRMNFFKHLGGRRVFSELKLILEEETPIPALLRMQELNIFQFIYESIIFDENMAYLFESISKVLAWHDLLFLDEPYSKWIVYFMALTSKLDIQKTFQVCENLELSQKYTYIFVNEKPSADKALRWLEKNKNPIQNSILYKHLKNFKIELILYMMGSTKKEYIKKIISNYYTRLRPIKTIIKGKDLTAMGFKPGPDFGIILNALLNAKLNNEVRTKEDEKKYVIKYASENNILSSNFGFSD